MEIEADLNKPYVKLDKENCILLFKGKSYPEHPSVFYEPILKELNNCIDYMDKKDVTINLACDALAFLVVFMQTLIFVTYDHISLIL